MKTPRSQLGLVAEGNTTGSSILRLEKVIGLLGPVKSMGLSAARRLSNTLRAGHAVARYDGLADCLLVLLRVPDAAVPKIVDELASATLEHASIAFVLCETWLGFETLDPLKKLGAQTASVMTLPVGSRDWFVIDGDQKAVRLMRRLIENSGSPVTELGSQGKDFLFGAELLLTALPIALFHAAQQSLRVSGFSGNLLTSAMDQMLAKTCQDFLRGAKGKWGGPLLESSEETTRARLSALAASRPDLAELIEKQIESARRLMDGVR